MRGITKAFARAPTLISSKVGSAHKSVDPEFDELVKRFTALEKCASRVRQDAMSYRTNVQNMLTSGAAFGDGFKKLYSPLGSEGDDLAAAYPHAQKTLDALPGYKALLAEVQETLTPEIELLDSRIVAPLRDLEAVCSAIRKNITKRDHKLLDLQRRTGPYEKVKDKEPKTPKEEEALSKAEKEYEVAKADWQYFNDALKADLPQFFALAAKLGPLWYSLYWMQLNILYLTFQAIKKFAQDKHPIDTPLSAIEKDYSAALGEAMNKIDQLAITKPPLSSAKILGQLGRAPSGSTVNSPPPSTTSGIKELPTTKEKPEPELPAHVIALYDFTAQAEGDLSFSAGDQIQLVSRTDSKEDWWTGKVNDVQGVFPGNYLVLSPCVDNVAFNDAVSFNGT